MTFGPFFTHLARDRAACDLAVSRDRCARRRSSGALLALACRSRRRVPLALSLCALLGCGDDAAPADAATPSDTTLSCMDDSQCDDDLYCNGAERCDPSDERADARGCLAGPAPCTPEQGCDETGRACRLDCPDEDGDGVAAMECGGTDCDDGEMNRFPGNMEVCDAADLDEDCDPSTYGVRDADRDFDPDAACCNGTRCGLDCDDARPNVSSIGTEACDSLDNDCDTNVDEGVLRRFYPDADRDLFGDTTAAPMEACTPPPGYVEDASDCNDSSGASHPGLIELCDAAGLDEDCDGTALAPDDPRCQCTLGDPPRACERPGACRAGTQTCSGVGEWGPCSIAPTVETCNGADDDCDGATDETPAELVTYYRDADSDGFGDASMTRTACPTMPPAGFVTNAADCDDADVARNPGAAENPGDGNDSNCDGTELCYYDADDDGQLARAGLMTMASTRLACDGPLQGTALDPRDDCCDTDARARRGQDMFFSATTACGDFDFDCDGVITRSRAVSAACTRSGVCSCALTTEGWYGDVAGCGVSADLGGYCLCDFGGCDLFAGARATQTCR